MSIISINSNVASMGAQRQLASASASLGVTFERLASGQRINRASDDAAGLSVANQLNSKSRLYSVAIRNITDATSVIGIASSVLQTQSSLLDRLGELATQSMNGTLSDVQRSTLNREYQQLVREFGRLGDTTTFNGIELLRNGRGGREASARTFQAGVDGSTNSLLSLNFGDTGTLSGNLHISSDLAGIGDTLENDGAAPDGQVTLDDTLYGIELANGGQGVSRAAIERIFAGRLGSMTVTDSNGTGRNVLFATFSLGDQQIWQVFFEDNGSEELFIAGSALLGQKGATDAQFRVSGSKNVSLFFSGGTTTSFTLDYNLNGFDPFLGGTGSTSALDFSRVSTVESASAALEVIAARRAELTSLLSTLGASESRLLTSLAVVRSAREAVTQAESRIRDADIAAESAKLTLEQIRQNAATSVLSQANQQPALALALLQTL